MSAIMEKEPPYSLALIEKVVRQLADHSMQVAYDAAAGLFVIQDESENLVGYGASKIEALQDLVAQYIEKRGLTPKTGELSSR